MIVVMDLSMNFDDPAWVAAELGKRNRTVYADGATFTDPSQEAYWAVRSRLWDGVDATKVTAAMVNRGQLMDLLL
jgi:hypothetical protein